MSNSKAQKLNDFPQKYSKGNLGITILVDPWLPFSNGVITRYHTLTESLKALGHKVLIVHNKFFKTIPVPTYPDLKLAINPFNKLTELLDNFSPDAIHIATEGPIGIAGRNYCKDKQILFTSGFHTLLPGYVNMRYPFGDITKQGYEFVKWFHKRSTRVMVSSQYTKNQLSSHGIENELVVWQNGVDRKKFRPLNIKQDTFKKPVHLYVGRIAPEKNLEAFLDLELEGSKVLIGGGPDLERLKNKYEGKAIFTGVKKGEELVELYNSASVFVFPSKTDTFGNVILEANACGIPVAAYPTTGQLEIVKDGINGYLNEDLGIAIKQALIVNKDSCIEYSKTFSLESSAEFFLSNLCLINGRTVEAPILV